MILKQKVLKISDQEVIRLFDQGFNNARIVKKTGLSFRMVAKLREQLGYPKFDSQYIFSPQMNFKLRMQLYEEGLTDLEIALEIGVMSSVIVGWRRKCGLQPNSISNWQTRLQYDKIEREIEASGDNLMQDPESLYNDVEFIEMLIKRKLKG